jgi:hypothetical protein
LGVTVDTKITSENVKISLKRINRENTFIKSAEWIMVAIATRNRDNKIVQLGKQGNMTRN